MPIKALRLSRPDMLPMPISAAFTVAIIFLRRRVATPRIKQIVSQVTARAEGLVLRL